MYKIRTVEPDSKTFLHHHLSYHLIHTNDTLPGRLLLPGTWYWYHTYRDMALRHSTRTRSIFTGICLQCMHTKQVAVILLTRYQVPGTGKQTISSGIKLHSYRYDKSLVSAKLPQLAQVPGTWYRYHPVDLRVHYVPSTSYLVPCTSTPTLTLPVCTYNLPGTW